MSVLPFRAGAAAVLDANAVALRRLASLVPLSAEEAKGVLALPLACRASPVGSELCAAGAIAPWPRVLVQGWACRMRMLPDGRRQMFDLVLPGDLIGSLLPPYRPAAAASVALTPVETANAAPLAALLAGPGEALPAALAALDRQSERLLLDQITRLGRQTAYERTAHLLIEIKCRLAAVGLACGNAFPLPLRQDTIADLLGLSVVHVNRTLQQMRRDRVLELRGGVAVLLQPGRLQAEAGFDTPQPGPSYGAA